MMTMMKMKTLILNVCGDDSLTTSFYVNATTWHAHIHVSALDLKLSVYIDVPATYMNLLADMDYPTLHNQPADMDYPKLYTNLLADMDYPMLYMNLVASMVVAMRTNLPADMDFQAVHMNQPANVNAMASNVIMESQMVAGS